MHPPFSRAIRPLLLSAALVSTGYAIDAGPVAIHGAVSATASYSDRYDYLGNTAGTASINLVETILNANYRLSNGLRLSSQLYAYKVGDYTALTLDFASLDYSFNQRIGVRLGRVRHGEGLSGESQDVDMIRPFAYLPLDFYSKAERPLASAIDGAQVYGNLRLSASSSVDYQIFGGWLPKLDPAAPLLTNSAGSAPFTTTDSDLIPIYGGWIAWNTPLEGLRLSTSAFFLTSLTFRGPVNSASSLARATSDARLLPGFFPPGAWDFLEAGKPATLQGRAHLLYFSAEYTRGNWQFSAEARYLDQFTTTLLPILGAIPSGLRSDSYYAMTTWQAAPKLQFGTYYALGYANRNDRHGRTLIALPAHTAWLKDFAFATSYNLAPWWLLKAEVHLLNGTKGIGAKDNGDAATWRPDWTYFALKTTVTF